MSNEQPDAAATSGSQPPEPESPTVAESAPEAAPSAPEAVPSAPAAPPPATPAPPATTPAPPAAPAAPPAATPAPPPAPAAGAVPPPPVAPPPAAAAGAPADPYQQPAPAYGQPAGAVPPGWQPAAAPPPGPPGVPAASVQAYPQSSNNAVIALILAIVSWVVCPIVMAIAALIFASKADKEIKLSNGWLTGSGLVLAAKILSWINIALYILIGLFFLVVFIIAAANGGFEPTTVPSDDFSFSFGT